MKLTISFLAVVGATVCTIASAMTDGKCPLWAAVGLLCLAALTKYLPKE